MYSKEEADKFTSSEFGQKIIYKMFNTAIRNDIEYGCNIKMSEMFQGLCASSWDFIAAVDKMVSLGVLREIQTPEGTFAQDRLFTV